MNGEEHKALMLTNVSQTSEIIVTSGRSTCDITLLVVGGGGNGGLVGGGGSG